MKKKIFFDYTVVLFLALCFSSFSTVRLYADCPTSSFNENIEIPGKKKHIANAHIVACDQVPEVSDHKAHEVGHGMRLISHLASSGNDLNKSLHFYSQKQSVKRFTGVSVNEAVKGFSVLQPHDTIHLNLFEDAQYLGSVAAISENVNGTITVVGSIAGFDFAYFIITTTAGRTLANISIPGSGFHYQISSDPNTLMHYLVELDLGKTDELPGSPPIIPPIVSEEDIRDQIRIKESLENRNLGPNDPATISVMIVYTPAAQTWANNNGGGIENVIAQAMTRAQLAMDNSATVINIPLVHSSLVNYTESGNSGTDLNNFTFINGVMDEIHDWRDTYGADLNALFTFVEDTGGLGWLLTNKNGSPAYGFSITRVQQASWTYTHIHEMGHNMGCHHHKEQTVQPGPTNWWNWAANVWSAGWRWTGTDGGRYCSIMTYESGSYFPDGINHTRVALFSSPVITYQGVAAGHATDGDNRRTIREIKHVIAAYREVLVLNPATFTAVASGAEQIDLSWNKNANNDNVMLVWNAMDSFGTPEDGTVYTAGQSISGGGTVLYRGSETLFEHTSLIANTTYYYKAYSYNSSDEYSAGIAANATTPCYAINSFPFLENFNTSSILPDCWEIVDHQGNGQVWQFGEITGQGSNNPNLTPNYAFLNSDAYGSGNSQNADLITPVFDFTGLSEVTLGFSHYFRQYLDWSVTSLYYSIDNGLSWNFMAEWTESTANPAFFSQTIPALNGQENVRFKWNYTGSWGYYWAVDDVQITATPMVPNEQLLQDISIESGEAVCFDATQTIILAGDGTYFTVENNAAVELVAGENILMRDGVLIENGAVFIARITQENQYCNQAESLIVSRNEEVISGFRSQTHSAGLAFRVFPNPSSGQFFLEFNETGEQSTFLVEIYSLMGERLLQILLPDSGQHLIDLSGHPSGIYLVRFVRGNISGVVRVVRN